MRQDCILTGDHDSMFKRALLLLGYFVIGMGMLLGLGSGGAAGFPFQATSAGGASSRPGQDFGPEAKLLYRVVACQGKAPLPAHLDAQVIARHCQWMLRAMRRYQRLYLRREQPFFAKLLPADLVGTVVYPFGGGDLLSALNTYPHAQDITTISLELVGDPRRIHDLDARALDEGLTTLRHSLVGLLSQNDSASQLLMDAQRGNLAGQLCFFLVGLAVHGYEPVSLRYFRIAPDGSLHYYSDDEIQQMEGKTAAQLHRRWTSPDFSLAFANCELTFRARTGDSTLRIHRHIAANLDNAHLRRNPALTAYLRGKGRVVAMTKAASYCLWNPAFTRIRNYLLESMDYMVSDSTGIPPAVATQAGFVEETYGSFHGSFLEASKEYNDQFRELWASQPMRKLPFRYGYLDSEKGFHLLVTRRAKKESL